MKNKKDCPLCAPKDRALKENEHAYFMLSNPRKVPGHTLVIPKRHIEKPTDLTSEELISIFMLISHVEEKLLASIATGCDIRQHYQPYVMENKFKVDHVHFHVVPRTFEDELYRISTMPENALFTELSKEEHDTITKLLN